MTVYKKISGKYDKLHTHLGKENAPPTIITNEQEYQAFLDREFLGTPFVSFSHSALYLKDKIRKYHTNHLVQRDIDAGGFLVDSLTLSAAGQKALQIKLENNNTEQHIQTLGFAFLDNDGNNCGLSIIYLRKDPNIAQGDENSAIADRPHIFSIGFIRNTTFSPEQRDIRYFMHPEFLIEGAANTLDQDIVDISDEEIHSELKKEINSDQIYQLIEGLFRGDQIHLERFNQLNKRLIGNKNIDNRDLKLNQLNQYFKIVNHESLTGNNELFQFTTELNEKIKQDINLFNDENYPNLIKEIEETIKRAIFGDNLEEEIEDEKERKTRENLSLKLHVTSLAVKLEFRALELSEEQGVLQNVYLWYSQFLYTLCNSNDERLNFFKTMDLESLLLHIENLKKDIIKLQQIIAGTRHKYPNNDEIEKCLINIEKRAFEEPDFFDQHQNNIETCQLQINSLINNHSVEVAPIGGFTPADNKINDEQKAKKHFLQRNAKYLGSLAIGILVAIPSIVLLTLLFVGVFNPFGIIVLGGGATVLGITLTTIAAIFTTLSLIGMTMNLVDLIETEYKFQKKTNTSALDAIAIQNSYIPLLQEDIDERSEDEVKKDLTREVDIDPIHAALTEGLKAVKQGEGIQASSKLEKVETIGQKALSENTEQFKF